jgi:hypothetical protein
MDFATPASTAAVFEVVMVERRVESWGRPKLPKSFLFGSGRFSRENQEFQGVLP